MNDSTNYGWVRLHRKLLKSDMWLSEPFTKGQAWIDLFANANHKEGTFWVRGNPVRVGRGQIGWSKLTMSDRWGWSEGKVNRFLDYLKTEEQIEVQTSSKTTLITILNYELYQADSRPNKGADSEQTASRQGTNKNDKKEKNISALEDEPRPKYERVPDSEETPSTLRGRAKYGNARVAFAWFPEYEKWWDMNTSQLKYGELVFARGEQAVRSILAFLKKNSDLEDCPEVTTPYDLETKWKRIEKFAKRNGL